jgi:hypothetical protein
MRGTVEWGFVQQGYVFDVPPLPNSGVLWLWNSSHGQQQSLGQLQRSQQVFWFVNEHSCVQSECIIVRVSKWWFSRAHALSQPCSLTLWVEQVLQHVNAVLAVSLLSIIWPQGVCTDAHKSFVSMVCMHRSPSYFM